MNNLLLVAAGGMVGSVLRYLVYVMQFKWLSLHFPYATLFVNVIGAFIIGLCSSWLVQRGHFDNELRLLIMVGLLGSFTTFATFSLETLKLLQTQQYLLATLNITINVVLCLVAAWLGNSLLRG